MTEKYSKFDSINFHLLRHLGWQAKSIGPLFTTSAAMFESANRLLIAPLTGTVNFSELIVQRFVRSKMLLDLEIQEDSLSEYLRKYKSEPEFNESYGFVENENIKTFSSSNPDVRLFCRFKSKFYLSSVAYERGSLSDKYDVIRDGDLTVGEIQFFSRAEGKECSFEFCKPNDFLT